MNPIPGIATSMKTAAVTVGAMSATKSDVSLPPPPRGGDHVDQEMEVATEIDPTHKRREDVSPRTAQRSLMQQVEALRPELLPLLRKAQSTILEHNHHEWKLDSIVDAVALSQFLQDRLLCLPELNHNTPCYSARSIVLLYTKIRYLETFPPAEIAVYAVSSEAAYEEVRLLRELGNVASKAELYSRLAAHLQVPTHGDAWNESCRFVACALPFAEQTETLLIRGSDDRSILCPIKKSNKYHSATVPLRNDIARSSCTCSATTLATFTRCERLRQEMLLNAFSINPNARSSTDFFNAKMGAARDRIANCLGIAELVQEDRMRVLLTPSGSDAELLATSAALARAFSDLEDGGEQQRKVTSIICAQGEVGRGTSSASGGKHFNALTPSGEPATPGQALRRYPTNLVDIITLPGRTADGVINDIDGKVRETASDLLEGDHNGANVVLLHVVMGTKTGYSCPSLGVVDVLAAKYPNRLIVVIDACQMRIDRKLFGVFGTKGYITLTTGSKFFGGAPFCGAVLMPMRCVYEMETAAVDEHAEKCLPSGLEDYFSKYDIPESMRHVRQRLGSFMNVGLLLRWESALVAMEPYFAISQAEVEDICRAYVERCKAHMKTNFAPMLQILTDHEVFSTLTSADAKPMETIISFRVWDSCNKKYLDPAQLRDLHALISKDLSRMLPSNEAAMKRCLLGQPVQLGDSNDGVLRVAMGADMVNKIFYEGKTEDGMRAVVDALVSEDDLIFQKIDLILQQWDVLRQEYIEENVLPAPVALPKPLRDWNFGVKKAQISRVMRKLCNDGVVGSHSPTQVSIFDDTREKLALVYDLDAIDMAFQALLTSFPSHFEHRFAMKSCPLSFFIKRAIENDVGVECASIVEVQHAIRLGCPPHKIVFDSPCKTPRDIAIAIKAGVELNADSFDELETIREYAEEFFQSSFPECTPRLAGKLPRIGVRINPLLGSGTNQYLSVSTVHSKFGIPLTRSNRQRIIEFFRVNPWMSGLHCHVGSQGCGLEMLASGATILCDLANEIDSVVGGSRVKVLNIGGGLPSNYESDDVAPTFVEYVDVLRRCAPQLFERTGRTILTEFGRSVSSKTGWTVSEVEYVKHHESDTAVLRENGEHDDLLQTAIIHAGSELFVRTAYRPEMFPHRVSIYTAAGLPSTAQECSQNIAGPLCFGGDLIGYRMPQPKIARGDFVVIHDTGSNTISLFSRHCSRPAPAVYGYRVVDGELTVDMLKPAETPEAVMNFWG